MKILRGFRVYGRIRGAGEKFLWLDKVFAIVANSKWLKWLMENSEGSNRALKKGTGDQEG